MVYSHPRLNWCLRNLNKAVRPFTSFRLRPFGVLNVRYDDVQFKMATNETSYVTKQLFWRGPSRFEYTPIFERLVRMCRSFVDIGANTGYYSLMAAKANPEVVVHAFEPASGPFHYLTENVRLNRLEGRIFPHDIALSNERGIVQFFEILNPADTWASYNLSGVGGLKKTHDTQEHSVLKKVQAETLDGFLDTLNTDIKFDLIKIDTEGTEDLVLEGAESVIRSHHPIIICETLFNKIEAKLETIMRAHGYYFFNHQGGRLARTETLVRARDNGVTDCFFVHPGKIQLIQEFIQPD